MQLVIDGVRLIQAVKNHEEITVDDCAVDSCEFLVLFFREVGPLGDSTLRDVLVHHLNKSRVLALGEVETVDKNTLTEEVSVSEIESSSQRVDINNCGRLGRNQADLSGIRVFPSARLRRQHR